MTSALDAYQEFMALRHYFNSNYDYFKYNGKIKLSWRIIDNFEKRKDFFKFQKLSKHPDLQNFILANILQKSKIWIHELVTSDECEKIYIDWKKRKESFSYIFTQEISHLPDNLYNNFSNVRIFLTAFFKKEISLETLYILYMMLNKYGIIFIEDDFILNDIEFKLKKYKPFMEINFLMNEDKILKIVIEKFGSWEK